MLARIRGLLASVPELLARVGEGKGEDLLGRAGFAEAMARQIRHAPKDESFVIALLGPWGSGKTSILNMVEERLQDHTEIIFLRFNPWLFSGTEQLVAHFFHEMAAQLRERAGQELREVGRAFEGYSRLLSPLRVVPGATSSASERLASKEPSIYAQRRVLDEALRASGRRLVIVIDDIDRLHQQVISDVMRLVRLMADFPSTTYLLAFDRERVEVALGGVVAWKAYIEKIVQATYDVPELNKMIS